MTEACKPAGAVLIRWRAASCRFSDAVAKDIWVQIGRWASARLRTSP
jgi:hypothetical protein